jgi:hypothetical protein
VKHLRSAAPRRLDARFDRHLRSPHPKRLPRDSGKGSFMPGLSAELDETEVMVGYESPEQLADDMAGVSDFATKQNMMVLAGAAVLGFLLFKR